MTAPLSIIPESAPFSSEQRAWLNGFLAGLHGAAALGRPAEGAPESAATPGAEGSAGTAGAPLLILYGSQSGNTEALAHDLATRVRTHAGGRFAPRVLGMEHFAEVDFTTVRHILMLSSTWGDGDMPDNAVEFWNWLQSDAAPSLGHTAFAVLGLGDRNYRRFCQAGKNLDGRFDALGARRLRPLCECDTDYEENAAAWVQAVLAELDKEEIEGVEVGREIGAGISVGANHDSPPPEAAIVYDKKNPFSAALVENRALNARASAKDTRHLAFSLAGDGPTYKAGDALGVLPRNDYDLADRLVLRLNCGGSERVALSGGTETTLRAALLTRLDLRRVGVPLLEVLLAGARNPAERARLEGLLAAPDGAETREYLKSHDVLDVLEDFARAHPDPQAVVSALGKLTPRLYSIASSPLAHAGEVHLCVGVVRERVGDRLRRGVASTFLAERVPLGTTVPVYIQPSPHFGVPEDGNAPLVMVGPGTGIAPFRGFLHERRARGDAGPNWLFFGDQRRAHDFLYREELEGMHHDGHLTRLDLAFSRDQEEKVYVQDRMLEHGRELFDWLERGARFCVCGDAKRMAKDVDAALHRIVAQEGGLSEDKAREYIEGMKKDKRYVRDVY